MHASRCPQPLRYRLVEEDGKQLAHAYVHKHSRSNGIPKDCIVNTPIIHICGCEYVLRQSGIQIKIIRNSSEALTHLLQEPNLISHLTLSRGCWRCGRRVNLPIRGQSSLTSWASGGAGHRLVLAIHCLKHVLVREPRQIGITKAGLVSPQSPGATPRCRRR